MKLGGIVLASLLTATSCQNEEIVSNEQQNGNYSLTVSSLVDSRTYVNDEGKVLWSEGDKMYVYGTNVSGVLTLSDGANSDKGTFTGFVFGNPDNLKWAVFGDDIKATANGVQFTISSVKGENSNSPMVGSIINGDVQMEHLCGMVRITINDLPNNATVMLKGNDIAGTAEWNGTTEKLSVTSAFDEVTINVAGGDQTIEIPVFATGTETDVDLTLSVNDKECSINAPVKIGSLSQKAIMVITCITDENGNVTGFSQAATTEESLRQVLQSKDDATFQLGANITVTEKLTVANKATIDLNGFELKLQDNLIEKEEGASLTITGTGVVIGSDPTQYLADGYKIETFDGAYIVVPNDTDVATDTDDLQDALTNGATNIIIPQDMTLAANSLKGASNDLTVDLAAGTTITVASGVTTGSNGADKNLTFTGDTSSKVVLENPTPGNEGKLVYLDGVNLTFKGITIDANDISGICARGGVVTFVDCSITGELEKTIASKFEFIRCNFDVGVTQVGYGCPEVVFESCTFETNGYGIKIYKEANEKNVSLTVKGCSFKNTGSEARSAILLDHIIDGFTYNIIVETCTFEGYTATPTATYNKWAARMIVADSFVKTANGQYIFSYQTGVEGGNYHKTLTAEQLVVTVK